jgi:hypothetical protein
LDAGADRQGPRRSGKDPGGIIVTMLTCIVGAFIGGFTGNTIAGLSGPEWILDLEHPCSPWLAPCCFWLQWPHTRNRTTTTFDYR